MKEGYKLIVSYVEGDNSASENENGWVSDFIKFLEIFANRLSRFDIKVLLYKDLEKEADLTHTFGIPVLSPIYLQDANTKKELDLLIKNTSDVFRVQKHPVSSKELPEEILNEIAYKFYERSFESDSGYIEYNSQAMNKNYWLKLVDLAYDIVQKAVRHERQKSVVGGKVVYLAETTFDQENNRDTLRRELQRYGHLVLPDHPLSENSVKMKTEIEAYLDKSDIAIHMVGAHYGKNVNGTETSLIEYQNKIAGGFAEKKFAQDGTYFKRYLWSPPYMKPADEKQMLYLDRLKEEIDRDTNAEIIQVPLEILKSIVEKTLVQTNYASTQKSKMETNGKDNIVYLIYDKNDEKDVQDLRSRMEKLNISVRTPSFQGNQMELLHQHRANLIDADAVFIYSKTSNQFWLNSKVNDLIKSPGFGRVKPYKVQAICVPNGKTTAEGYKEFSDIIALDKLNDDTINSFLSKLK